MKKLTLLIGALALTAGSVAMADTSNLINIHVGGSCGQVGGTFSDLTYQITPTAGCGFVGAPGGKFVTSGAVAASPDVYMIQANCTNASGPVATISFSSSKYNLPGGVPTTIDSNPSAGSKQYGAGGSPGFVVESHQQSGAPAETTYTFECHMPN